MKLITDSVDNKSSNSSQVSVSSDIAVIGMDCLFPGAADLDSFWQLLVNQESAISEVPLDRWDWRTYYGDPSKEINKTNIKWGGFVDDLDKFDASFFNISPREASLMDPQQRILLQSVWKGLENAGYAPLELSNNNRVGFFVGASTNDYYELLANNDVEGYSSTGGTHSITANRVSYIYDFKGPSIAIDTACSSSLIALDMAVKSLQDGRCGVAIIGGVNALITPTLYLSFSKAGMLSPDGKISPLDKQANGYVRGEGVGVLVLKRLDKAIEDNDNIQAIIKGTSVNHGGKVSSLTVPSPKAQSELIVDACKNANVDVSTLNHIEMHGTGTPLGDPIEVNALKNAFKTGAVVNKENYCGIASVKGNIGHLEAAAGVAGVIKAILALKNKKLPGQCNFEQLNPHIQLEKTPFKVIEKLQEWEALKDNTGQVLPRRAGVSSFGFGGANSHIVLEEYIEQRKEEETEQEQPSLIVISAATEERLKAIASSISDFLLGQRNPSDSLRNIAYTLQVGREMMNERLGMLVHNQEELQQKLTAFINGEENIKNLYQRQVKSSHAPLSKQLNKIDDWISHGEYYKLLESWVEGVKVDWNKLYLVNKPQKISLPTYPFSKERYWISHKGISQNNKKKIFQPKINALPEVIQPIEKLLTTNAASDHLNEKSIVYFKILAASTLQMPVEKIESTRPLEEYGMDSILVMQMVNALHSSFPSIDSTILFKYRTIEALANYFLETKRELLIQAIDQEEQRFIENYSDTESALNDTNATVKTPKKLPVHDILVNDEESTASISQIAAEVLNNKVDFKDALRMVRNPEMEEK